MIIGKDLLFKTLNEAVERRWKYALEDWSVYSMSLFNFTHVNINADWIPAEYIPKELIGISESDMTIEQFDLWCNARESYAMDFESSFRDKVLRHIQSLLRETDAINDADEYEDLKRHLSHVQKRAAENRNY